MTRELSDLLRQQYSRNTITVRPGDDREALNDALRRAATGENLPIDPPAEPSPPRASGGSGDGGQGGGSLTADPSDAINRALRQAMGRS